MILWEFGLLACSDLAVAAPIQEIIRIRDASRFPQKFSIFTRLKSTDIGILRFIRD